MERGDLTGAILDGRYRVLEPVAEGAMGVVYRAERIKLGRIVAIKVLHDLLPDELSGRKRFEIEALAMAKLEHPHCASVLDIGVHGARPFVVMDFVSGQNLKQLIGGGPLPAARAADIMRQVLSGLAHAHEHGIIHRDIKPANIVLSQKTGLGDHVKILDFGLARLRDTGQNLTAGLAVGTPAYMSPEQIRGQKVDLRADLYACGVLLFELLTGKKPYHSEVDDPIEVCRRHLSDPIPRLDSKLPGTSFGELENVVAKALAKKPAKRFATAEAFAAALNIAVGRAPRLATPLPIPESGPVRRAGSEPSPPAREVRTSDVMAEQPAPSEIGTAALISLDDSDAHGRAAVYSTGAPRPTASAVADAGASAVELSPAGTFLGIAVPKPTSRFPRTTASNPTASPASQPPDDSAAPDDAKANGKPRDDRDDGKRAKDADAKANGKPRDDRDDGKRAKADREAKTASAKPAKPTAPKRPWRLIRWLLVGLVVAGGAAVAYEYEAGRDEPAPAPSASPTASEPSRLPDPGHDIIDHAAELTAQGNQTAALELLNRGRKQHPDSAGLAYAAGRIYFTKLYWTDGLKAFRDAIRIDPSYRTDPDLMKAVLRGFLTTPGVNDELAGFLRAEIGAPARPLLEEAAHDHPSPIIRTRAASELRHHW